MLLLGKRAAGHHISGRSKVSSFKIGHLELGYPCRTFLNIQLSQGSLIKLLAMSSLSILVNKQGQKEPRIGSNRRG